MYGYTVECKNVPDPKKPQVPPRPRLPVLDCGEVVSLLPQADRPVELYRHPGGGHGETIGVQTTSRGNVSARVKKIQENEYFPELVRSGWKIHCHGWGKLKAGWTIKLVELN